MMKDTDGDESNLPPPAEITSNNEIDTGIADLESGDGDGRKEDGGGGNAAGAELTMEWGNGNEDKGGKSAGALDEDVIAIADVVDHDSESSVSFNVLSQIPETTKTKTVPATTLATPPPEASSTMGPEAAAMTGTHHPAFYSSEPTGVFSETISSPNHDPTVLDSPTEALSELPPIIRLDSAITPPIRDSTIEGNKNYNNRSQGKSSRRQYPLEKQSTDNTQIFSNKSKDKSNFDFFWNGQDLPATSAPKSVDGGPPPTIPGLDIDVPAGDIHPLKQSPPPPPAAARSSHNSQQQRQQRQQQQQSGPNNQTSVAESPYVKPLLSLFQDPATVSNIKIEAGSVRPYGGGAGGVNRGSQNYYENADTADDVEESPHMKMISFIQFPNPQPSRRAPPSGDVSFEHDPDHHHHHHHHNHDASSFGSSLGDPIDDGNSTDGEGEPTSQKVLESHVFRSAAMAIPGLAMAENPHFPKSIRAAGRTVHKADRMVSLTVDMETGRTGTRGQYAVMRGGSFAEAQSPRLRRRRGWSNSIRNARNKLSNRISAPFKGGGVRSGAGITRAVGNPATVHFDIPEDASSDDSAIMPPAKKEKSSGVHGRLVVKKRSVMVDDEPVHNQITGQIETRKTQHEVKQYRLSAMTTANLRRRRGRNLTGSERGYFLSKLQSSMFEDSTTHDHGGLSCCFAKPNQLLHRYLSWAFRNSFTLVFVSAAGMFYFFTIFFAFVLSVIGRFRPNCIYVNGEEFGMSQDPFMDAYALSWTTFTTVGYGVTFPATSATTMASRECIGVSIMMTLEAFVGMLFSSFWGAIFFSKITRVSSHAQVTFSDAIIVKYGIGVSGLPDGQNADDHDDNKSSDGEPESFLFPSASNIARNSNSTNSAPGFVLCSSSPVPQPFRYKKSNLPCPFMEFRVVNNLYNQRGGEIIDATLNVVASMDESQTALSVKNAIRGSNQNTGKLNKQKRRRRRRGKLRPVVGSGGMYDEDLDGDLDLTDECSIKKLQESVKHMVVAHNKAWALDLDPSGKFLPKRIFCKLDFESQEHPFFKRIWQVRHVLDHNSPLLKQEAKEMIRLNGGCWPRELNNPEAVRASIHFDQILVSLSGTSNVDANPVYAQKVYDFVDMCIGYSFCNMLFRDNDGGIQVDPHLLNDVTEQEGGGGELLETETYNKDDIFVL